MMLCVKYARNKNTSALFNLVLKNHYSRRSDKNTNSYKLVKSNSENVDDVDGAVFGTNPNWELLTPRGYRFYLPGSIGPGWSDATTTIQANTQFIESYCKEVSIKVQNVKCEHRGYTAKLDNIQPMLYCTAQECPLLLRKGIEELFPGYTDLSQLTIITINQKTNLKTMRWSKEIETEKLAKYFVLAASDICAKLKLIGYWADFINPFSGKPHLSPQKNSTLYKTDERFRCLGFKIERRNNCRIILYDNNMRNFMGNLYTTAPASTEFLKGIMSDCEVVKINDD